MSHESVSRDQRLQDILAAYLQDVENGKNPDREKLLAEHPDLADDLRSFLAENDKMHRLVDEQNLATVGPEPSTDGSAVGTMVRYFGDYELLEEIARGGMGVVYKARQVSLNRTVALKMILKGELASPADVQRFQDEARAAANLDHPNIVPIYEIGNHEGQQYFSMKLIGPGQRRDNLGIPETVRVVALVARAVHHAHQRGILHRDLKPGNILFDENGEPCVGDFGLAKQIEGDSSATKSGVIVGTPSYMAPEQARAEKGLTIAVDVYSLGAVLYEWLTGRPPFRGTDVMSTMMMVINDEPPRPRSLNCKIDRDLETICLKCLEKDPSKRYGSAEALAEDLERWQQGKPILARRVGPVKRLWRWCRRKPALAAVTFVALLSTFGALALFVYSYAVQNEAYCRSMVQTVEIFRKGGRIADARGELRRSRDYYWFGTDAEWRGAALQVAASPELHPLRQVKIAEQDVPVRLEWEDADQVRISIGEEVQIRQVSTGELVPPKPIEGKPQRTPRLTEASAKVLASLPKDAVFLGRSANDAWAVLRLKSKEAGKERVVLWDAQKQAEQGTLPDVGQIPDFVLVSPDGRRMAYVDPFAVKTGETVRVWDWQWRRFSAVLDTGFPQDGGSGKDLASLGGFSPDGEMLITRGRDQYMPIWQVASGRLFTRVQAFNYLIAGCQWSPDSRKLAIVGPPSIEMPHDGKGDGVFLQVWEVRYPSPSYAGRAPVNSHQASLSPLFSPAGQYLGWSGQFWKTGSRDDNKVLQRMEDAAGLIHFGPDGSRWVLRFLLSKDHDHAAGQTLHAERLGPDPVTRSLLLPDSKLPGGKGAGRHLMYVAVDQDGRHALLATCRIELRPPASPVYGNEYLLEWWDLAAGKRLAIWNESAPEKDLYGITLVADGRFAVTNQNLSSKVWEVASGKVKETLPSFFEGGYCLSADRRHLCRYTTMDINKMSATRKPTVMDIHEIATGQLVQHLELRGAYGSPMAFHLQTGWMAAQSGLYLELWNLKTGKLWARWQPHEDALPLSAALSPDGELLVTSSGNILRLWPLPLLQQEVAKLER